MDIAEQAGILRQARYTSVPLYLDSTRKEKAKEKKGGGGRASGE